MLWLQASIRYNESVTAGKGLRTQIDSLRRERLVFDGIHAKLSAALQVRAYLQWSAPAQTLMWVHRPVECCVA